MSKRIRIGNDIEVNWTITNLSGSSISLEYVSTTVWLCVGNKNIQVTNYTVAGNVISFVFYGSEQEYTGAYVLKLCNANRSLTYDVCNAFILVDHSWQSVDTVDELSTVSVSSTMSVERIVTVKGDKGDKGDPGDAGTINATLTIGENGNWYIDGVDTGVPAGGVAGDAGSFKSIVFKRSESQPSTPSGGTYANPVPSGWNDGIPSGSMQLWASVCTFNGDGTSSGWSTPRAMSDSSYLDVEFAKKQTGDATPSSPTTENRHGGSGTQIWFDPDLDTTEDYTEMYWMAMREYTSGAWGSWTIMRIKGEKGDRGDGQSSFKSTIFVRMNDTPTKPGDSDGSFANPAPATLAGQNSDGDNVYWSDGIPDGQNILWATSRIFTANGAAPQQASWDPPRKMTDTSSYNVEFAEMQTNDAVPDEPSVSNSHNNSYPYGYTGQVWYDPVKDKYSAEGTLRSFKTMYWRAEQWCSNGVWGDWLITRIQGEKGATGDPGRSLVSMTPYYKASSQSSGVTAPTVNASLTGWYTNASDAGLSGDAPYLWCFYRCGYSDSTYEHTIPFIARFFNDEIDVNYVEITNEVRSRIAGDLNDLSGRIDDIDGTVTDIINEGGLYGIVSSYSSNGQKSFGDLLIDASKATVKLWAGAELDDRLSGAHLTLDGIAASLEAAATKEYADNKFSDARTLWEAGDEAAITSSVTQSAKIWVKESPDYVNGVYTTKRQFYPYQIPSGETAEVYEARMKTAPYNYELTSQSESMSVIRQKADEILLAVGTDGHPSAAIKLIAGQTVLGGKIILDAGTVDITGILNTLTLNATTVNTGTSTGMNTRLENGLFTIYNGAQTASNKRAAFGLNSSGECILSFYNTDGVKLYDLGPGGLKEAVVTVPMRLHAVSCQKLSDSTINGWSSDGNNGKYIYNYSGPNASQLGTLENFFRNQPNSIYYFTDGYWYVGSSLVYSNPFGNSPSSLDAHSSINEDYFGSAPTFPKERARLESENGLESGYTYIAIDWTVPYSTTFTPDNSGGGVVTTIYTAKVLKKVDSATYTIQDAYITEKLTMVSGQSLPSVAQLIYGLSSGSPTTLSYES